MELLDELKKLFSISKEEIRNKATEMANRRYNIQRMKMPCGAICDVVTIDGIPVSEPLEPETSKNLPETLYRYRQMYIDLCVERSEVL